MKNKKRGNIINILLLFIFSFLVIFLLVKDDFSNIITTLRDAKWVILLLVLGLFAMTYIMDALILMISARKYKKDYSFKEGIINALVGNFFSAITPSATGGQFSQAYVFSKQGVKVEHAASSLVLNFICYEFGLILFSFISLVFGYRHYAANLNIVIFEGLQLNILILSIIGFVINFAGIFLSILLAYSKLTNRIIDWLIRLIAKMKLIKDPIATKKKIDRKVELFRAELSDIKGNWKIILSAVGLHLVRYTVVFSIPFFCAIALNVVLPFEAIFASIALSSYLTLITAYIPIPGASGGAELFFGLLFGSLFLSSTNVVSGMLLWRFITFYFTLFIGLIVTLVFNHRRRVDMLEEVPPNYLDRYEL